MAGTSPNAILQIVKGVAKVPQDTLSSEVGLDTIDLLDPQGFSCDEYDMQLPDMKGGAVWADSPLTDGRTLISGALGNVKETLRINLTAGTLVQMAALLSKLARFRQDCNDFWDTFGQIEPVYLKHQVEGEPGPRYALLYDIEMNVESPITPGSSSRMVTLVIERETYWRGLAPGDNPKHWYYLLHKQSWVNGNTQLLTGADHIANRTIQNRMEVNSTISAYVSQNFLDIPAASIPGDAPALCMVSVTQNVVVSATTILIAKASKPITGNLSRSTGNNQLTVYNFVAADSNALTDTSNAADVGAPLGRTGVAARAVTTFATATMQPRLNWQVSTSVPDGFSTAIFRGKFMVFLRARVSAAANVSIQLRLNQGGDITTTPVVLTDLGGGGTGASTDWALLYLGLITEPSNNKKAPVSVDGRGLWMDSGTGTSEIQMFLEAARNSGAGSLYVSDLIFIPIDEGAVKIASALPVGATGNNVRAWIYDNTGYLTHGVPGDYATMAGFAIGGVSLGKGGEIDVPELSGGSIMLTPAVNNRLYFLAYVDSTKRSFISDPSAMAVRVDIVPRWSGLRDS